MAIPAVEKQGALLLEDVGVSLPLLGDLVTGIEAIAGDGNTHPLLVLDPMDPAQQERAQITYGEVMDLATGLGETITGEYGVGRLKAPVDRVLLSRTVNSLQ